jgi:hypothetical protein
MSNAPKGVSTFFAKQQKTLSDLERAEGSAEGEPRQYLASPASAYLAHRQVGNPGECNFSSESRSVDLPSAVEAPVFLCPGFRVADGLQSASIELEIVPRFLRK